jgi:hypothetical protein
VTSDGKITVPESPPALQTEKEIKENDKIIVISPNESRTGPCDQKDSHHEEADGPGSKPHCGREQAEINEHACTLADMAAHPMPSAKPGCGSHQHSSERCHRDGPSCPAPLRSWLSGTPTHRRCVGPEWGPPHHGELVGCVHGARSIPCCGSVSPCIRKEKWVCLNEWTTKTCKQSPEVTLTAADRGEQQC